MINWKVRFKNPVFYVQLVISIMSPIFAYLGITAKDITTWDSLLDIFKQALSNPYIQKPCLSVGRFSEYYR